MQNRLKKFVSRITDGDMFEAEDDEFDDKEESDKTDDIDKLAGFIEPGYLHHYSQPSDEFRAE
jgi:hypothetical protein